MKVALRKKKLKDGSYSLYLDVTETNKAAEKPTIELKKSDPEKYKELFKKRYTRQYEFLNIYIRKDMSKAQKDNLMRIAKELRSKREIELLNNEYGIKTFNKKNIAFTEYFNTVLQSKKKDKSTTAESYDSTYKVLKNFLEKYHTNKRISFRDLDKKFLVQFIDYMKNETTLADSTIHLYFSKVAAVLELAVQEDIIEKSPVVFLNSHERPKFIKGDMEHLKSEELQKLIDTPCENKEIRDAFLFSCFTGLRRSDIKNLTWGNIVDGKLNLIVQKTNKKIDNPLSEDAIEILNNRIKNNVIPLPELKIFNLPSNSDLNIKLKEWVTAAGIKKHITYHASRHTYGCLCIRNGIPVEVLKDLMGHSNIQTTMRYVQIESEHLKEAVAKLPKFKLNS